MNDVDRKYAGRHRPSNRSSLVEPFPEKVKQKDDNAYHEERFPSGIGKGLPVGSTQKLGEILVTFQGSAQNYHDKDQKKNGYRHDPPTAGLAWR